MPQVVVPSAGGFTVDIDAFARHVAQLIVERQRELSRPPVGRTFGELVEAWLATRRHIVAPENERRVLNHLEALHGMREEELTPRVIQAALDALLRPAGPLGASTVNRARVTAGTVIREAQANREWGSVNPFTAVRGFKEPRPRQVAFSLEECRAFLPYLSRPRWREAVFQILVGTRPGEMKALQKQDVDARARTVTVRRSNARNTTKTGRDRTIPLTHEAWSVLEEAMAESPSELVFPRPDGKRQRSDVQLSKTLRAALRRAGIVSDYRYICRRGGCGFKDRQPTALDRKCPECAFPLWRLGVPRQARWYDLRHTSATLYRQSGCDPLVVSLTLGHAPKNITEGTYTHLNTEYMRRELGKLSLLKLACVKAA